MKSFKLLVIAAALPLVLSACKMSQLDSVTKGFEALTLSDAQVTSLTNDACAQQDASHKIASNSSTYGKRLAKIHKELPTDINGKKATYKVYQTKEINAWAMANGCIRIYSGLMDFMTDDEVRGVIAHEIGHVHLGHTLKAVKVGALANIGADALASSSAVGGVAGKVGMSTSQIAAFSNQLINSQFSQKQEYEADAYAYDWLVSKKRSPQPFIDGLNKLASLSSGTDSAMTAILSSHPDSKKRAETLTKRLASGK
ncbi:peptidase-related chaperone [Gammaproteobacteria bacterium]|nr:peptidase-related chaperone [Gammaproteobacteria bacterium]